MLSMGTKDPFLFCVILLSLSISLSFSMLWKLCSVWIPSIILITFSSGMMVLVMYSSSLVSLKGEKKLKIKSYFLALILIWLFKENNSMEEKTESFFKEFSSSMYLPLMALIMLMFMIPMIENCFVPFNSLQSSF
uniref:NADH dehydrogenase subunit 6 n=1 Tax=Steganacarus magnus TaxID=52000 RepID=B6Z5V3_9ACAR|nr:NADH dehydrogenase subunit 6 [Steganacarus magnus]ACH41154.1 NADH dehydrogenase subunit 6 [Steganacarus magnus]